MLETLELPIGPSKPIGKRTPSLSRAVRFREPTAERQEVLMTSDTISDARQPQVHLLRDIPLLFIVMTSMVV